MLKVLAALLAALLLAGCVKEVSPAGPRRLEVLECHSDGAHVFYVVRDAKTGREFIAVCGTGCGVAEIAPK